MTAYPLTRRQQWLYIFTVSLYSPAAGIPGSNKKGSPRGYSDTPTYQSVPCLYIATEDFQFAGPLGTQTEDNIMTQDKFLVHQKQAIGPEWKIRLTGPIDHPFLNYFWTVQGEPKVIYGFKRQNLAEQQVYAKLDFRQSGMV